MATAGVGYILSDSFITYRQCPIDFYRAPRVAHRRVYVSIVVVGGAYFRAGLITLRQHVEFRWKQSGAGCLRLRRFETIEPTITKMDRTPPLLLLFTFQFSTHKNNNNKFYYFQSECFNFLIYINSWNFLKYFTSNWTNWTARKYPFSNRVIWNVTYLFI